MVGIENVIRYKIVVFFGVLFSVEFLVDLGLCLFEVVKVRV